MTLTQTAPAIIRAEDVVKRFGRDVVALAGVSLAIEPHTIYALLGPNGAGKTTLIRILTTLLEPDEGTATVAGIDVVEDPVRARTRIGLAGQSAALDGFLTGRENVRMVGQLYGLSAADARQRTDEVLRRIELHEAGDRQVKTYSGGMRRRLDLAASLVGRPQVLFLDEPTTGIDPRSRIDIWDIIRDLVRDGTTILMTTQYLEEADELADRIGVIDQGRLIAEGTAAELKGHIGGAVIEVIVSPEEMGAASAALTHLTGDEPLYEPGKGCLVIPAEAGARTMVDVVRILDEAGLTPIDLEMHKPTLDQVFLTLTGRPATAEDDDVTASDPVESGGRGRWGRRR